MGFLERLAREYGLREVDGSLDRTVPGYVHLQREVILAHVLAHKTCKPEIKKSVDELAMDFIDSNLSSGYSFSEDYRELLKEMFREPNGIKVQKCEVDWEDQMRNCLFLHDMEKHYFSNDEREKDLRDHFIAGRVIYNRLLENENMTGVLHLPSLYDKVA
jgi:hypothetical protein